MNAIFLTTRDGSNIQTVYARSTIDALMAATDMDDTIYTQEEVLTQPEKFQLVRYIFSTWGMPQFTAEQIRSCLPKLECVLRCRLCAEVCSTLLGVWCQGLQCLGGQCRARFGIHPGPDPFGQQRLLYGLPYKHRSGKPGPCQKVQCVCSR